MPASIQPVPFWMRSAAFSILTDKMWLRVTRLFLINFWDKVAKTTSWSEIFLILSTLEFETISFSLKVEYRLEKRHGVVNHVTEGQKDRILFRYSKNYKMQNITVFCNYSCSVAADTFGLYYSVNRQDMKLDRVTVFWYSRRCGLGVKMQCNI
jgi:hypothetical protein